MREFARAAFLVHFLVDRLERAAAIFGTFAAHLRATAAVGIVVLGAFLFADLAGVDADGEDRTNQLAVVVGAPGGDAMGRFEPHPFEVLEEALAGRGVGRGDPGPSVTHAGLVMARVSPPRAGIRFGVPRRGLRPDPVRPQAP